MRLVLASCVLLLLSLFAGRASAQVTGEIVLLDTNVSTAVPTDPVDVWGFQVANNSGFSIFTFNNLNFSGDFLQDFGQATNDTGSSLPAVGPSFFADTFFTDDVISPTTFGAVTDDGTTLSAESVATLGGAWVNNAATEVIAVLTVDAGGAAPVFNGGTAVVNGNDVSIVSAIPEPGSALVLGLGALLALAKRRKS